MVKQKWNKIIHDVAQSYVSRIAELSLIVGVWLGSWYEDHKLQQDYLARKTFFDEAIYKRCAVQIKKSQKFLHVTMRQPEKLGPKENLITWNHMSKTARGIIKNYIISLAPHVEAMPSISSLYYYLLLCHSQLSTISVLFLRWKTTTIHGKHPCLFLMPSTAFLFWVIIRQRLMLCK